ncbi:MAG: hypothetical protein M3Z09_10505 [Acidobacteriota bacterium]|nr:hypothetical protein [Acidobacteriota bacterium]
MLRLSLALASAVLACSAAERIDNVLIRLVPENSVSLFGAQMEQVKATPLYQKLMSQQQLPQLDEFAATTNFDPRRDVRELLIASNLKAKSGVLLARGNFRISADSLAKMKDMRKAGYRGYTLWTNPAQDAGFCILDSTLAIAGPLETMHAALDRYQQQHAGPIQTPLIQKALTIPMRNQVWMVSMGGSDFLTNNLPGAGNGANFGRIFRNLENTEFQADLSRGFYARVHGMCRTDADAKSLADAARGLVGFGRLSVPDSQPQLLRVWDAIQVEQQARDITVSADIPGDLVEKLIQLFDGGQKQANGRSSSYSSAGELRHPESTRHPH